MAVCPYIQSCILLHVLTAYLTGLHCSINAKKLRRTVSASSAAVSIVATSHSQSCTMHVHAYRCAYTMYMHVPMAGQDKICRYQNNYFILVVSILNVVGCHRLDNTRSYLILPSYTPSLCLLYLLPVHSGPQEVSIANTISIHEIVSGAHYKRMPPKQHTVSVIKAKL